MKEGITKIDLNFSNSGSGHTASVSSVLNAKNIQNGSDGLGAVRGSIGDVGTFSHPEIHDMMSSFVCTETTTSKDSTKTSISRKYVDRVSRLLKSYIVLVRGKNAGPESPEYEGPIPFFTEVSNSPLPSFKSEGPRLYKDKSVILAGRIYNMESATTYEGFKLTLVYNNKKLVTDLCVNEEFCSPQYKASPDLAQFDLKLGYTATDFIQMLALIGINVQGIEPREDILFEQSGTLDSVVSSIASFYGFYWFVDPKTMTIKFVDTASASMMRVEDFTATEDESVVTASFTESETVDKNINVYIGTAEQKEDQSQNEREHRGRKVYFKALSMSRLLCLKPHIGLRALDKNKNDKWWLEIGILFGIFNQDEGEDCFNKMIYYLSHLNQRQVRGQDSEFEKKYGRRMLLRNLYKDAPWSWATWHFYTQFGGKLAIYRNEQAAKNNRKAKTKFGNMDRIKNRYQYKTLMKNKDQAMEVPSASELYKILKLFFALAGGFYISNAYSAYRVDRMIMQNTNRANVIGPFHRKEWIGNIPELAELSDFFDALGFPDVTIGGLARLTEGEARQTHDFHWVAIRNIKKLTKNARNRVPYDKVIMEFMEIVNSFGQGAAHLDGKSFLGVPAKFKPEWVWRLTDQSLKNYEKIKDIPKRLPIKYERSKTRVNRLDEDGEEEEDNKIASSDSNANKMSELFDRFDFKAFGIDGPVHSPLNNLSLQSASGSTTEMEALRLARPMQIASPTHRPSSSSRTIYGLFIPEFNELTSNVTISLSSGGVQTTITESSIKLIPPDQQIFTNQGMEVLAKKSFTPSRMAARQRNALGY